MFQDENTKELFMLGGLAVGGGVEMYSFYSSQDGGQNVE